MTITLTSTQTVWSVAGILFLANCAWWKHVESNSRGGYLSGMFEGLGCVILTLLIIIVALVATILVR